MHRNTKYWAFTWQANKNQKKIPDVLNLKIFLDEITETAVFQLEKGSISGIKHYQGNFTLIGVRSSKISLLGSFEKRFKNIAGLTLSKTYDKTAAARYSQKSETRIEGPWFAGKNEKYDIELSNMKLKPWQQQLYDLIINNLENKEFQDRKVIWVEDHIGNSGKSYFIKWLRTGQRLVTSRKIPVSSVDRLNSAVAKIAEKDQVNLFTVDITKTKGEEQSYKDLFAAIEDIKNGYIVDVMYGKYVESIFKPPLVIVFTNQKLDEYKNCLSQDRWLRLGINPTTKKLEHWYTVGDSGIAIYPIENGKIKK